MKHNYKRPESVLVVVYTASGEVLMLRRTRPQQFWQSVTGSLEWGENPRQAAERELFEETGLQAAGSLVDCRQAVRFPIIHPWRRQYRPGAHYNREHWFIYPLPCRRLITLNPSEHKAFRWLSFQRAARLATSWSNRDLIRQLAASQVIH